MQDPSLRKIFLEKGYRVIWVFIDGLLSKFEPSNEVIKQCGNRIHDLGKDLSTNITQHRVNLMLILQGFC